MRHKYVVHPFVRIVFDGNTRFVLEQLLTKKTYEVSAPFLTATHYCATPHTFQEIIEWCTNEETTVATLSYFIKEMIASKILITQTAQTLLLNKYRNWYYYDWWLPLHFLKSTEEEFYEDKTDRKKRKAIMKTYLLEKQPAFYKVYSKKTDISLPRPQDLRKNLFDVLMQRRTSRSFVGALSTQQLSNVLYTGSEELNRIRTFQKNTYTQRPEVLLYSLFTPFEVYLIVNNVKGIDRGAYHYNLTNHSLSLLKKQDLRRKIISIAQGQTYLYDAGVVLLIAAVFDRYMFRYRHARAFRELLATTAELAHSFILAATAHDMKTFETPALKDSELEKLLGIDGFNESVLYLVALGT